MNGKDHFERVRCNWCASEFDEEWVKGKGCDETCPVCGNKGFMSNLETIFCAKCGYHLALSDHNARNFKETHSDGDCYSVYGEDYYLLNGKFYCQECWDEMQEQK